MEQNSRLNPDNDAFRALIKESNWSLPLYGIEFTPKRSEYLKGIYTELVLLSPLPEDKSWFDVSARHWKYSRKLDEFSKNDINRWCTILLNWAMNHGLYKNTTSPSIQVDDFTTFDAYCRLEKDNQPLISISLGILSSLDDFFQSLFVFPNFYLENKIDDAIPEFDFTILDERKSEFITPHIRYFDYRKQIQMTLNSGIPKRTQKIFFSHFYAFPYGDSARVNLGYLFSHIALTWIFFHEYSHIKLGHLNFLKSIKGKSNNERINISESKKVRELDESFIYSKTISTRTIIEWESDILATKMTFEFWKDLNLSAVIGTTKNKNYWKWRAILTSLMGVIVLLEKAKIIYGQTDAYPEPRSRIFSLIYQLIHQLLSSDKISEINFDSKSENTFYSISSSFFDISMSTLLLMQVQDEGEILESSDYWRRRSNFIVGDLTSRLNNSINIVENLDDVYWWALLLKGNENMGVNIKYVRQKWLSEPFILQRMRYLMESTLAPFRSEEIVSSMQEIHK